MPKFNRRFWERAIQHASDTSRKRFIASYEEYLESVWQQAVDRSGHYVRDIESYFHVRRDTIGAKPVLALLELDLDIPDAVYAHPAIQEIVVTSVDMITIANVSG